MKSPRHFVSFLFFFAAQMIARAAAAQAPEVPDPYWVNLHRMDDRDWAQRTQMSVTDFRKLRLAAGINDGEPFIRIEMVNAKTLPRQHILFVTAAGNGHCLAVSVYEHSGKKFRQLWSVAQTPGGAGFCRESFCSNPSASATKKGKVLVTVPLRRDDADVGVCDDIKVLKYRLAGRVYKLTDERTVPAKCTVETYSQALSAAFAHAAVGETLAIVQVLPSFHAESAIALERTANGVAVVRLTFRRQLWAQLGLGRPHEIQTPSHCIDEAKSAELERAPLSLSTEEAQRFLDSLARIDLRTDTCPRYPDGKCAYVMDGTSYLVQLPDGRSIRLTDTGGPSGVQSENPPLSKWVEELLSAAGRGLP